MQKISFLILVLLLGYVNNGFAQKKRADKTSGGKAAYGVSIVKSNGKVKKPKKGKKEKIARRKKHKSTPSYRKTQNWAG